MGVDPTGKHGVAAEVDRRRALRRRFDERCDFPLLHADARVSQHAPAAIERAIGEDDDRSGRRCRRWNWGDLCAEDPRKEGDGENWWRVEFKSDHDPKIVRPFSIAAIVSDCVSSLELRRVCQSRPDN